MNNMSVFTESKALRLAETSNPAYMVLDMIVCTDDYNLNGDKITKEGLEANAESLVDMPVQVDRYRLEKGLYSSLTHKASKEGLKTDSVGVITKVWLETDEDTQVTTMYASAKIWKRYKATCEAIAELYEDDNLKFSWELVSTDYVKAEDGTREHNDFYFMGHCIVSMPSYPVAKAQLLVAELTQDSDIQSEVNGLKKVLESEELEVTAETVEEVISETVEEVADVVEVVEIVEEEVIADIVADTVTEPIVEEVVKAEDMSEKMVAYAEAIATLTETVATLKSHIAELEPYRLEAVRVAEEKAKAEIEARKAELKLMAEKVVKEELTAEMNDAIESQDENSLKLLIADFVIANVKPSESIVEEKQEDVVIASSTKDEEYIVQKEQKIRLF